MTMTPMTIGTKVNILEDTTRNKIVMMPATNTLNAPTSHKFHAV